MFKKRIPILFFMIIPLLAAVVLMSSLHSPAVQAAPAGGSSGGPVVLGGDDQPDHGSIVGGVLQEGWIYIRKVLESLRPNVTRAGHDNSVAVLGAADSTATSGDAGGAYHWAVPQVTVSGVPTMTVTFYEGAPAITQFFTDLASGTVNPAIIVTAGTGASNDLDSLEGAALTSNATAIAQFVNSGGGLLSHGSGVDAYGWLSSLFPGVNESSGCTAPLTLTAAGSAAFPGLTSGDISSPCHSHFSGSLGVMQILATDTLSRVIIIGGDAVTLPVVTLDKSVSPTSALPGDPLTYTLAFENAGLGLLTGVVLTDIIPSDVTGVSYSSSGVTITPTGGITYTWSVADLAPGASGIITITGVIDNSAVPGTLTNNATIVTDSAGDSSSVDVSIIDMLALVPTKTAEDINGAPLYNGDVVRYTIDITNTNSQPMTNVVVTDTLPAGVTFDSATPAGYSGPNPLVWNVGSLAPGANWTASIDVHVDGTANPIGGNVATVNSDQQSEQSTAPVLPPGGGTVTPFDNLELTKTAEDINGAPLYNGDTLRYTINITNTNPQPMTNVVVTDTLPAGVTFDSATPAGYSGPNPLVWNVGSLAPGANWTASIDVHVDGTANPIGGNVATVNSDQQNEQSTTPVFPPGGGTWTSVADLAISQSIKNDFLDTIFTIVAQNDGPDAAPGAVISITFPTEITNITWTCVATGGATCAASGSGNTIYDTLGSFPSGGVVTYTVDTRVVDSMTYTNAAEVIPPAGVTDPDLSNNTSEQVTAYLILLPVIFNN